MVYARHIQPRDEFGARWWIHCISLIFLIDYTPAMLCRFLNISLRVLVLAAYVVSFSVLPAIHSHPLHDQEGVRHVHIQSSGEDSQKSHSPNCIFCLRLHSTEFTLTRTNPVAVMLVPREFVSVVDATFQLPERFEHCRGRAPPAPLS